MGRNDVCFCGSGKKYKKCHSSISDKSKLADMYRVYNKYDLYVKNHINNNCTTQCYRCCKGVHFFVSENEFLMILDFIITNFPEKLDDYIFKAIEFEKRYQRVYPEKYKILDSVMCQQNSKDTLFSEYFSDDTNQFDEYNLPECIFIENKKCSIYSVRPIVCRTFGTSRKCEFMNIGNDLNFNEMEELVKESTIIQAQGKKPIIKRMYPLFYWFSFFLNKENFKFMLKKLQNYKNMSNTCYYDYSVKKQSKS